MENCGKDMSRIAQGRTIAPDIILCDVEPREEACYVAAGHALRQVGQANRVASWTLRTSLPCLTAVSLMHVGFPVSVAGGGLPHVL